MEKTKIIKKNSWRYRKRELAYRAIDYAKAFIDEHENKNKNFKKLKALSDNSNQFFIDYNGQKLAVTKMPKGWKYRNMYSITYSDISIAFIWLDAFQSPDMIEITGQGLTIFTENIFYFLFDYFKFTFIKFKRVDLCFDLKLNINYFYNTILNEEYKPKDNVEDAKNKIKPWISAKNGLETLDIWDTDYKKNSYQFIRIYNKILDSKKKKKLFLYDDLYKKEDGTYEDVTRFEVEMREDLVKKFEFNYLKQYDFQFYRIVKSFYKMNIQFFKFLKDEDFLKFKKEYNKKNKTIIEKIKSWIFWGKNQTQSQDRIEKIMIKKAHQNRYGTDFVSEADKKQCIAMFNAYGGRLLWNNYTFLDLYKILKQKFDK